MPEIVFVELDPELARTEPDPDIHQLIQTSAGLNLALDYLPGAVMFDPIAEQPDPELAAAIVWFDAFVTNVDRTPRNSNILIWHRRLWLIDHGAALYAHHEWDTFLERSRDPFPLIKDHVLLRLTGSLGEADSTLAERINRDCVESIGRLIPDDWLNADTVANSKDQHRDIYVEYLLRRLKQPRVFLEDAIRARSLYL